MRFLNRILLAWLLMLAIPLQGFAATAMLFCAPAHHSTMATKLQPSNSHHGHDAASSASGTHAHQATAAQAEPAKVNPLGGGKCSSCTTCCTGSVLVSTLITKPVATTSSVLIPFALASFASHVPEGFDPPPRSTLA